MSDMSEPLNLLFRGATVIDGTGKDRFTADLAVSGDTIVAVGDLGDLEADRVIDAAGLVLAPGWIDAHSHDDAVVMRKPDMTPKVSQGVTTVITGQCGVSAAPLPSGQVIPDLFKLTASETGDIHDTFSAYLAALDANPSAVNVGALVGHSSLRVGAMEDVDRTATPAEVDAMSEALTEGLEAGALGFSSGLAYDVAIKATTDEVKALSRVLGRHGGIYASHIRDEGDGMMEAIQEALDIAREGGVPVVISHFKALGRKNFGRTRESLALVKAAGAEQAVGLDVYPYDASSTELTVDRLQHAERTLVTWSERRPEATGRYVDDLAREMACSEAAVVEGLVPAGAVYFALHEDDVRRVLAFPDTMIGSDGLPNDQMPHPRLWGSFARIVSRYVRDVGLFSLEEAVRKMTGLPAKTWGIVDRGRIAPGLRADLVLFDPDTVEDRATFEDPKQPAVGIHGVWVNGRPVWMDGATTGERPGKTIRRQHT